uniref:Uncharacterized protein n=1 Tax=Romanomermis culicivorax TaxID=13658 RepID=A0A915IAF2_ROMCU
MYSALTTGIKIAMTLVKVPRHIAIITSSIRLRAGNIVDTEFVHKFKDNSNGQVRKANFTQSKLAMLWMTSTLRACHVQRSAEKSMCKENFLCKKHDISFFRIILLVKLRLILIIWTDVAVVHDDRRVIAFAFLVVIAA